MKKMLSIFLTMIMMISMILGTIVYAGNKIPTPGVVTGNAKNVASNALGLVQVFAYAIAVGMIMYLGIKYMMAPANEKADIKNASIKYVVGAVLVCAALTIANIILGFGKTIAS